MFSITVSERFSAAHKLKGEPLHGHTWRVEVSIELERLNQKGMAMDFQVLKKYLREVISQIDHKYLNDLPFFKKIEPTAENIALFIYQELKEKREVSSITVFESEDAWATYYPER